MKVKLTETQLRQLVAEGLKEVMLEEGVDEGRIGNFFSSLGGGAQSWWRNGGADAFRQGYNQRMAQRSQADADAAEAEAAKYRGQINAGYKNIPAAQKIAAKYDEKIGKLKDQITQLQAQKKSEMQVARKQHMSDMAKKTAKYNKERNAYANTATNAGSKATDMMNRRRASLGMEPISNQQRMVSESELKQIISESIKKYLA